MKNTFFPLSDVSTRAAVVFKYAGVEQSKHRLMEEENEKWKSAQKQNRAKLHESKHKLTFTKTKLSAEWQRRINREKKLESEQPKWVFLSSDDNTLPPLLCNLSSSSCSSERNKKGMCLLIWKRNDWNSVQYSIHLSTQPNAQPKGYLEKQNIKYNWSWVHRSRCSISCMTKCAQTWPHS